MKAMALTVDEYLASSTIHGVRYVAKSEHPVSRVLWTLLTLGLFFFAGFWIHRSFVSWEDSPYVRDEITLWHDVN